MQTYMDRKRKRRARENAFKLKWILFLVSVLAGFAVLGQTGSISGVVKGDGMFLPGASVYIKGTSIGTSTDLDGKYSLKNIPVGNKTIVFSFIGFDPKEIPVVVKAGENTIVKPISLSQGIQLQAVEIRGTMRDSEAKAINMTRISKNHVNIIAADGVGKLPDRNAGEAVQRVPGIVLERDHGEGKHISVRGTPRDWSSSLINDSRLPVADENGDSRTLSFDILPSDLIKYVVVSKTLTPDMEGDAIGGSVNFITKTAPEKKTLNINVGSGWNFKAGKPVYSGAITFGNRSKNEKFGYVLGASIWNRNYGTDNYEVAYGSNYNHGVNRLELRNYHGVRRTIGLNAAAEYKIGKDSKVFINGILGDYQDKERNRKQMFNYAVGAGSTIRLQHIYNIMQSRLWGGQLGGEFQLSKKLKLTSKIARYENKFGFGPAPFGDGDARNGYHVVQFEKFNVRYLDQVFQDEFRLKLLGKDQVGKQFINDADGSAIKGTYAPSGDAWDNIQPKVKDLTGSNPFEFSGAYSELNETWEKDPIIVQLDLDHEHNTRWKLKYGAKYRMKEGARKLGLHEWIQNTKVKSKPVYIHDFENGKPSFANGFLPEHGRPYQGKWYSFLNSSVSDDFVKNNAAWLKERPMNSNHPNYQEWVGARYDYKENVGAAYGMVDFMINEKWSFFGGVRVENTVLEINADTADKGFYGNVYKGIPGIGDVIVPIDKDTLASKYFQYLDTSRFVVPVRAVSSKLDYWSILPMFHIKYSPKEDFNIRFSVTRSFRRPNFNETKPGAPVIDFSNLEFRFGNRVLKPSYSWNFDLMAERFFKNVGMISAGVFYKQVKDHIFASITADSDPATGIIFKNYENAENSFVAGFECSVNKRLDFLPGIWSGLGVNGNYTITHSEMKVPGREGVQQLPRQAAHIFNLALYYEKKNLTARIAANYKSKYLVELNMAAVKDKKTGKTELLHQNSDYDTFTKGNLTLDFSASYKISKHIECFLEMNNLLNTPLIVYRGEEHRPMQVEYYSIRGQAGVRLAVFK